MNQEQIRQKTAKQYKEKIQHLEEENQFLKMRNFELWNENDELREQIRQQEDQMKHLLEHSDRSSDDLLFELFLLYLLR